MADEHSDDGGVVAALSTAAQQLGSSRGSTEAETLSLIVAGAVDVVPGVEHAGVSLLRADGSITSEATSSAAVDAVDQLQATYREGPCVTALWDEHTVLVANLDTESWRWPRFAPEAASQGVASMLSFQLYARQDSLGALNLYSSRRESFTADSQTLGGVFAAHAAMALGEAQHVAQLHQALTSRDVIGQAKGILMERFGLDAKDAFSMLVESSQKANMKLVAVAQWLTGSTVEPLQDD